jgi:crossover junction endodeoxyribonuclease RuvC
LSTVRLIGLDPGLRFTGWGIIDVKDNRLKHIANGTVKTSAKLELPLRLLEIHEGLERVIETYKPEEAAVEETFVNKNPTTTLKLGIARGVILLVPAQASLPISQYPANKVKKAVVGAGHANKDQVEMMVGRLLPGVEFDSSDSADALAIAICHAHYRLSRVAWNMDKNESQYR